MVHSIKQKTTFILFNKATNFVLLVLVIVGIFSYIYFANSIVHKVTLIDKTEEKIQSLNIKVSEMESVRLSLNKNLNTEVAKSFGFVEVKNQTFITKKSSQTALSLKVKN